MLIRCKNCHCFLKENARFCSNCGAPVEGNEKAPKYYLEDDRTEEEKRRVEKNLGKTKPTPQAPKEETPEPNVETPKDEINEEIPEIEVESPQEEVKINPEPNVETPKIKPKKTSSKIEKIPKGKTSKNNKLKILIPIIAIIVVVIVAVGIYNNLPTGNTSIHLTSTSLEAYIDDNSYSYILMGKVFNPPRNPENYILETKFYDKDGKEVYTDVQNLKDILDMDYGTDLVLGAYYSNQYQDLSNAKVFLIDSNGKIISNSTYAFNMNQMTFYDSDFNVISNNT